MGKIKHRLSIDELQQLVNVIKGDMSNIGSRPVILAEANLFDLREQHGANCVKSGVAGWARVNGRDKIDNATKTETDSFYAKNIAFLLDARYLLVTWITLTGAGQAEGREQGIIKTLEVDGINFYAKIPVIKNLNTLPRISRRYEG